MATDAAPPELVHVIRDGVVESVHRGHVVVADTDGHVVAAVGSAQHRVYARSAAKPFQAIATFTLARESGLELDPAGIAISCASHSGSALHQVEAARLLAEAGLDESALLCPPALPDDIATLVAQREPTPLAHNCSGKHAGFLLAHTASGGDPMGYLDTATQLQQRVRAVIAECSRSTPTGPGVDGCGAPAWLVPLAGLATGFARLAEGNGDAAARVRDAMVSRPDLVGGAASIDTALMLADPRIVTKRGAEAVLAAGWCGRGRPLGVAVKIADGGQRASGPAAAAVLAALGAAVPDAILQPPVLGGGRRHGFLRATDDLHLLL